MRKQIGPNVRENVVIAAVENSACSYVHLGLLQRLQLFALLRTAGHLQHTLKIQINNYNKTKYHLRLCLIHAVDVHKNIFAVVIHPRSLLDTFCFVLKQGDEYVHKL